MTRRSQHCIRISTAMIPTLPREFFGNQAQKATARRSCFRVLLIDDDQRLRTSMRFTLKARPRYDVVAEAATSTEAMSQLHSVNAQLVVMNIHLKDGALSLIRSILQAHPAMRILVRAEQEVFEHSRLARQAGAMGCVRSSTPPAAFVAALDVIASGGTSFWLPWPLNGLGWSY